MLPAVFEHLDDFLDYAYRRMGSEGVTCLPFSLFWIRSQRVKTGFLVNVLLPRFATSSVLLGRKPFFQHPSIRILIARYPAVLIDRANDSAIFSVMPVPADQIQAGRSID